MDAPKCKLCGKRHYTYEPHVFSGMDVVSSSANEFVPMVVHKVVHTKHGKYADKEKRKAYRREYMRKKRATA